MAAVMAELQKSHLQGIYAAGGVRSCRNGHRPAASRGSSGGKHKQSRGAPIRARKACGQGRAGPGVLELRPARRLACSWGACFVPSAGRGQRALPDRHPHQPKTGSPPPPAIAVLHCGMCRASADIAMRDFKNHNSSTKSAI